MLCSDPRSDQYQYRDIAPERHVRVGASLSRDLQDIQRKCLLSTPERSLTRATCSALRLVAAVDKEEGLADFSFLRVSPLTTRIYGHKQSYLVRETLSHHPIKSDKRNFRRCPRARDCFSRRAKHDLFHHRLSLRSPVVQVSMSFPDQHQVFRFRLDLFHFPVVVRVMHMQRSYHSPCRSRIFVVWPIIRPVPRFPQDVQQFPLFCTFAAHIRHVLPSSCLWQTI